MANLYKTTHRYLASYLMSKDYLLQGTSEQDSFVEFHFEDSEPLQNEIQLFYNNLGVTHPQDFIRGLDHVRSIIRELRGERERTERREP